MLGICIYKIKLNQGKAGALLLAGRAREGPLVPLATCGSGESPAFFSSQHFKNSSRYASCEADRDGKYLPEAYRHFEFCVGLPEYLLPV